MKLLLNSPNSRLRYKAENFGVDRTRTPKNRYENNNIAFGGKEKLIQELSGTAENIFSKLAKKVIKFPTVLKGEKFHYEKMPTIISELDDIFGSVGDKKFFSSALEKAGISVSADKLTYNDEGLLLGLLRTAKYPFLDMPRDILIGVASVMKKAKLEPIKKVGNGILNFGIIKNRTSIIEKTKNHKLVGEILKDYTKIPEAERVSKFTKKVANLVAEPLKEYESRDERTLNRIATSLVSAYFSGVDFYNLTMLHKDDKEAARESQKARFKQEARTMAISAGITFVSLGALSKYTKANVALDAIVIAGSALASQIISRLLSKTSLVPLSPEKAAKVAKEEQAKKPKKPEVKTVLTPIRTEIESKRISTALFAKKVHNRDLYLTFASLDGTNLALRSLYSNVAKTKEANQASSGKKKSNLLRNSLLVFGAVNAFYLLTGFAKGRFVASAGKKQFIAEHKDEIIKALKGELDSEKLTALKTLLKGKADVIEDALDAAKDTSIFKPLENIRDLLIEKKEKINLQALKSKILALKETEQGKDIALLLDKYLADIEVALKKGDILEVETDRAVLCGFYKGVTKIFKTVYDILSIPAKIIENAMFGKTNKLYKDVSKEFGLEKVKYKKTLSKIDKIFKSSEGEAGDKFNQTVVNAIKKATRNYETAPNTGELANTSRTMVTAISSYFFVNDYRNRALIESEGQDVDGANTVMKERIGHKFSNFVINGTLMNLANSLFAKLLNTSLLGATVIAACTEFLNESLIRFSICQPREKMESRRAVIEYEESRLNSDSPLGAWARFFSKITGKKSLTQKTKATK